MSPEAKAFLNSLTGHPEWQEILEAIKPKELYGYRPNHGEPEEQTLKWVFKSGANSENARILNILKGATND